MRLKARLFPLGEDSLRILQESMGTMTLRSTSGRIPVQVGDGLLSSILRKGDGASGFWISGESVFTRSELGNVTHFEIVCRKTVLETEKDYEHNAAAVERSIPFDESAKDPIRLSSGFSLSRIALKPNMVGGIGDWTEEYVIGAAVMQAFEKAGFTGWTAKQIYNPKIGSPHKKFFQIFSHTVLNTTVFDCSIECIKSERPEESGKLRHLGCLAYAARDLKDLPDFTRTAEPWGGWFGSASWVVSSRVKDRFAEKKLRGWAFRPVLTAQSPLYSDYVGQWQVLCEAVATSLKSQFDGGRW